ncbi:TOBE domain-containing protein, partial [Paenibacillus sp. TAF58]
ASKGDQLGKQGAIRPDDVLIGRPDEIEAGANRLTGRVKVSTFLGRSYQYVVETELGNFTVNKEMELPYLNGQEVRLLFPSEKLVLVE